MLKVFFKKIINCFINKYCIALLVIFSFSLFLNIYNLQIEGLSNQYYSVGVKSMLLNFKNWFYLAYDPTGFVSIDKPPIGYWIQSLFVKLFGFNSYSIILPQALAGSFSVILLYFIVKKYFGKITGLLSSIILATTPIFVAVSRNNTIDMQLLFVLLIAVLLLIKSVEKNNFWFLLLSFVFIGIGFNIKMAQAFLILPAFFLFYILSKPKNISYNKILIFKKLLFLFIVFNIMMIISLSWIFAVDITPEKKRPYVGGSLDNRAINLAGGFNGFVRLLPSKALDNLIHKMEDKKNKGKKTNTNFFEFEIGKPHPLRLINYPMADQISWLLPIALFCIFSSFVYIFKNKNKDDYNKFIFIIFWIMWLLPMIIIFSIAAYIHRHYLIMLAPAISALTSIGLVTMWKEFRKKSKLAFCFPLSILINLIFIIFILSRYYNWNIWPIIISCFLGIILLVLLILLNYFIKIKNNKIYYILFCLIFISLIISPIIWSLTPIIYGTEGVMPFAGPNLKMISLNRMTEQQKIFMNGIKKIKIYDQPKLTEYLKQNYNNEKYLAAVPSALIASPMMLDSNKPVMAIGGFYGKDKILNSKKLSELVNDNVIKYFVLSAAFQMDDEVEAWIKYNCKLINYKEWREDFPERINKDNIDILYGEDWEMLMTLSLKLYKYEK